MSIENQSSADVSQNIVGKANYVKPAMVGLGQMAQVTQKSNNGNGKVSDGGDNGAGFPARR